MWRLIVSPLSCVPADHMASDVNRPAAGRDDGWDAIVVAGGAGRRMGGRDKAGVLVGGTSLLERVLMAVSAAHGVVVVGPSRPLPAHLHSVRWTREDPPGGGPLAAVAAGLDLVRSPLVAVLAVDLPFVGPDQLTRLRTAVTASPDTAAATLVDPGGHRQPLAAMWRTDVLWAAMPDHPAGGAVRTLFDGLLVRAVPASERACLDCDDPGDVARARAWARTRTSGTMGR